MAQKSNKGFAGLESLLPDADQQLEEVKRELKRPAARAAIEPRPAGSASPPRTVDLSAPSTSSVTGAAVLIGILIVVLGIAWLIGNIEKGSPTGTKALPIPAKEPSVLGNADQLPQTAPSPTPAPKKPKTKPKSDAPRADAAPAPKPAPPVKPAPRALPPEEMPPVGSGLAFSSNQIRYCLFESARLDGMKDAVNRYSDYDVDTFNRFIGDYNSRCSNFRYRRGMLEPIQAEVEANKRLLESQGIRRLRGSAAR